MSRIPVLIVSGVAFAFGLGALPAVAQQGPGAPGTDQVIPEKDRSRPQDQPKTQAGAAGETLSDKLNRTDGVLKPPADVDPDIHKDAPATGTMPVIPPPGTPGSSRQGVDPK
jgi:hypothetical protein